MRFEYFRDSLIEHFNDMANCDHLFVVDVPVNELYELYLNSFPDGDNEIYRTNRVHDCSHCRHFIKQFGNVVAIKDYKIITLWDFDAGSWQPVVDALSDFVKRYKIVDVFFSKLKRIGVKENFGMVGDEPIKYNHFYVDLPDKFILQSKVTVETVKAKYRDSKNVFKRSLEEITSDSVDTVLELIDSNTLYRGAENRYILMTFKRLKEKFASLSQLENEKDIFTWYHSVRSGDVLSRIRNHSIGTLLTDISEGVDLDAAVRKYESIMAPANYKRPKAIFSKKMLEDARNTVTELGYIDSLPRRYANIDDITINNVLFANRNATNITTVANDVFGELESEVSIDPKQFSRVEEITVQDFIEKVIPSSKEIEVFMENRHVRNLVSMIAPVNRDAKSLFKWNNPLSWAYNGNVTSSIRQNVKDAGGEVNGALRFSIQWNDSTKDNSDLDAHALEPGGAEIYFGSFCGKNRRLSPNGGTLDIDITDPFIQRPGEPSVENIIYRNKSHMTPGKYVFFVNQFAARNSEGFRAEIEFDNNIYEFEYNYPIPTRQNILVAEVVLDKSGEFMITEHLKSRPLSKEVWGIRTNKFVPVNCISYSPNYFDDQNGIGHQHLFFFLNGCVNEGNPNGFYNEFLKSELVNGYKRVFEALGSKCKVANTENQLSGIGFSMTERAELIVKVKGKDEKIMKVKF